MRLLGYLSRAAAIVVVVIGAPFIIVSGATIILFELLTENKYANEVRNNS